MNLHGLSGYEKALLLWKDIKKRKIRSLSEENLAREIAMNIGCSKRLNTVGNYIRLMVEFHFIKRRGSCYEVNKEIVTNGSNAKH